MVTLKSISWLFYDDKKVSSFFGSFPGYTELSTSVLTQVKHDESLVQEIVDMAIILDSRGFKQRR